VAFDALVISDGREVHVVDEALKQYPGLSPKSIEVGLQQLINANVLTRPSLKFGPVVLFKRRSLLHGWKSVKAVGSTRTSIDSIVQEQVDKLKLFADESKSAIFVQKETTKVKMTQLAAEKLEAEIKLKELKLKRRRMLNRARKLNDRSEK
jgi:hypothetical protein